MTDNAHGFHPEDNGNAPPSWRRRSEERYNSMENMLEEVKKDINKLTDKLKTSSLYHESSTSLADPVPPTRQQRSRSIENILSQESPPSSVAITESVKEDLALLSERLKIADHVEQDSSTHRTQFRTSASNLTDSGFNSMDALKDVHPSETRNSRDDLSCDSASLPLTTDHLAYEEGDEDFIDDELILNPFYGEFVSSTSPKSWNSPSDYTDQSPFVRDYPELSDRTRDLLAKLREERSLSADDYSFTPPGSPTFDDLQLEDISLEDFIINADESLIFPLRPSNSQGFGSSYSLPPIPEERAEEVAAARDSEDLSPVEWRSLESVTSSHHTDQSFHLLLDLRRDDNEDSDTDSFATGKSVITPGDESDTLVLPCGFTEDRSVTSDSESFATAIDSDDDRTPTFISNKKMHFYGDTTFDCCESSSDSDNDTLVRREAGKIDVSKAKDMQMIIEGEESGLLSSMPKGSSVQKPSAVSNTPAKVANASNKPGKTVKQEPAVKPGKAAEAEVSESESESDSEEASSTGSSYTSSEESYSGTASYTDTDTDSESGEDYDAAGAIEKQRIRTNLKTADDSVLFEKSQQKKGFTPPLPPSPIYKPRVDTQRKLSLVKEERGLAGDEDNKSSLPGNPLREEEGFEEIMQPVRIDRSFNSPDSTTGLADSRSASEKTNKLQLELSAPPSGRRRPIEGNRQADWVTERSESTSPLLPSSSRTPKQGDSPLLPSLSHGSESHPSGSGVSSSPDLAHKSDSLTQPGSDVNTVALTSRRRNMDDVDFLDDVEETFEKTVVPAPSSELDRYKGPVTAVASSRALVKRGGATKDVAPVRYPTVSSLVKAEATGTSPAVAAARATAKAASIASASAAQDSGGGKSDAEEDLHIYISTSCTIRRQRPIQLELTSRDEVERNVQLSFSRSSSVSDSGDDYAGKSQTITQIRNLGDASARSPASGESSKENLLGLLREGGRSSVTCELPSPTKVTKKTIVQDAAYGMLRDYMPAPLDLAHEVSQKVADTVFEEVPPPRDEKADRFAEFHKTLDSLKTRHELRKNKSDSQFKMQPGPTVGINVIDGNVSVKTVPPTATTAVEEAHFSTSSSSEDASPYLGKKRITPSPFTVSSSSKVPPSQPPKAEYTSVLQTPVELSVRGVSSRTKEPQKVQNQEFERIREVKQGFLETRPSPPDTTSGTRPIVPPTKERGYSTLPPPKKPKETVDVKVQPVKLRGLPDNYPARSNTWTDRKQGRRFKSTDIDEFINQRYKSQQELPQSVYSVQTWDTAPGNYMSMSVYDLGSSPAGGATNSSGQTFFNHSKSVNSLLETDIDTGTNKEASQLVVETDVDTTERDPNSYVPSKTQSLVNLNLSSPMSHVAIFDFDDSQLNRAASVDLSKPESMPRKPAKTTSGLIARLKAKATSETELRIAESLTKLYVPEWLDNAPELDYVDSAGTSRPKPRFPYNGDTNSRNSKQPSSPRRPVVIPTRVSRYSPTSGRTQHLPVKVELPSQRLRNKNDASEKLKPIDSKLRMVMANRTEKDAIDGARKPLLKSLPKDESFGVKLDPSDFLPKGQTTTTTHRTVSKRMEEQRVEIRTSSYSKREIVPEEKPVVPDIKVSAQMAPNPQRYEEPEGVSKAPPAEECPIGFMDSSEGEHDSRRSSFAYTSGSTSKSSIRRGSASSTDRSSYSSEPEKNRYKVAMKETNSTVEVKTKGDRVVQKESSATTTEKALDFENPTVQSSKDKNMLEEFFVKKEEQLHDLKGSVDVSSLLASVSYSPSSPGRRCIPSPELSKDDFIREMTTSFPANYREFSVDPSTCSIIKRGNNQFSITCSLFSCRREEPLNKALTSFCSCFNCYTYYCSRRCRTTDCREHLSLCSFGRPKRMCSQVLKSLKPEQMQQFSNFAKSNFEMSGRGCILLAFESQGMARMFLSGMVNTLMGPPLYLNLPELEEFDQNIATPCINYNPSASFVLTVVICAHPTTTSSVHTLFKQCVVLPLIRRPPPPKPPAPKYQNAPHLEQLPRHIAEPEESRKLNLDTRPPITKHVQPESQRSQPAKVTETLQAPPKQLVRHNDVKDGSPSSPLKSEKADEIRKVPLKPTTAPPLPQPRASQVNNTSTSPPSVAIPPVKPREPPRSSAPPRPVPQSRGRPPSDDYSTSGSSSSYTSGESESEYSDDDERAPLPPKPTPRKPITNSTQVAPPRPSQQTVQPQPMNKPTTMPLPKTQGRNAPRSNNHAPVPKPSAYEMTEEEDRERSNREVFFARVQRSLRERGVLLQQHFPDVFAKLVQFVETGKRFPPLTIQYFDPTLRQNILCTLRPLSEPTFQPMRPPPAKPTPVGQSPRRPVVETEL